MRAHLMVGGEVERTLSSTDGSLRSRGSCKDRYDHDNRRDCPASPTAEYLAP